MYKVMIVDDERNIRQGIIQLIDWEKLNFEVSANCMNGQEALDILQEQEIDLVVTDIKMPLIDGLELAKQIKENYENTKVIILTSFSDFSFAQKAIKYNVLDFVIKNDFIIELPLAVEKAKRTLEKRKKTIEKSIDKETINHREDLLYKLIKGKQIDRLLVDKYKLEQYKYVIGVCEIDIDNNGKTNQVKMIKDFLNIIFKDCKINIKIIDENCFVLILMFDNQIEISNKTLEKYFNELFKMINSFMQTDLRIGLSELISNYNKLEENFKLATENLMKITEKQSSIEMYRDSKSYQEEAKINLEIEKIKLEILEKITKGEDTENIVERLCMKLIKSNQSTEQCKLDISIIGSHIIRKAFTHENTEDFKKIESDFYNQINKSKTMYKIKEIFEKLIRVMTDVISNKKTTKNQIVEQVNRYIQKNHKKNITLQEMSRELFLSSSYLSRAYKKRAGKTITDAIHKYRIDKAKELLTTSDLKIYEIGIEIGIEDSAYFARIFMKYVGYTPTEYRELHR